MIRSRYLSLAALAVAVPVFAQQPVIQAGAPRDSTEAVVDTQPTKKPVSRLPRYLAPASQIQYIRYADQRGVNVFESPKEAGADFTGLKVSWGGAFAQQYQNLTHRNAAAPKLVTGSTVDQNQLIALGQGFNNANANLYLNVQLARGIRVAVETYASSRHHNEAWVKDGYFLIDGSPIANKLLDRIMEFATLKVGHFEVNYGDQHFRRSDNGQTLYNPFIGNFVIDAFTTEIGAEAYLRKYGYIAMLGMTGGEVKGQVTAPGQRGPSYLAKLGVDRQLNGDLRVRLTGSMYKTDRSVSNTLTSGDR